MGTLTLVLLFMSAIAQGHSQVCSNFPEGNYFEPAIDLPKTCLDLFCQGYKDSGVYQIHPSGRALFAVDVYCDQQTDGGGWTVFQRRIDETVNFYRNWQNYKLGFGEARGNHWLGLDIIHKLLSLNSKNQLRIDMEAISNEKEFALYKVFNVGDEASGYVLTAKEFAGSYTAGDSFGAMHSGQKFTTFDRDNDQNGGSNCADKYKGSWWYKACHTSNLNGRYLNGPHSTFADGINWNTWKGYRNSLKTTEMKFRETY